jgi:DNA polymerase-3 subunit alpha
MRVKEIKVKKFYVDIPDVDLDFEPEGRDKVKNYIKNKYGLAYSCSVGTYTRAKLRTCLKDFGRVLGVPYDTMNVITKDIDEQLEYEWQDLFKFAAKNRRIYKFIQEHTDIVFLTKWALNTPKAESVHPSAVLILPDQDDDGKPINVYGWMPVKKIDGILVSEWEGKYTESELYLKEDILGLNQLTKFHHILNLVKRDKGKVIEPGKIPLDDDEVFEYFRNGWCQDVFQFGTQSLMNYCKQVKPTEFSDLIAMSALFRPGPIASNAHSDFADIKNGRKKPKYDYGIKNITEETYSLLVYQEQMMSIIHQLGGLSLIDAENARKYIKKKKHKELAAMGSRFIEGAERNGCPEDEAKRIWDKMNAFSSYSFNKSHAAAYSLMSYWSNWFKVHYPLEFWITAFDLSKDSSDIPYMMNEMIATGVEIEVRPPDINHSDLGFTCDPKNNRIFYSLSKIKGIGPVAVQNIIDTRNQGGEFFDLEEFLERVPKSKVNKGVVVKLILAGAFDLLLELPNQHKRRDVLKHYLEDIKGEPLPDEYSTAEAVASDAFWIMKQKELTGFGDIDFSMLIRQRIDVQRVQRIYLTPTQLERADDGKQAAIAGRLIYFRERKIKSGTMVTLTIDNNNSILSVVCWPDSNLTEDWLDVKGKLICITGVVKRDTYRGKKTLYTDAFSRLYLLSEEKTKFSKRDEWLNSKK